MKAIGVGGQMRNGKDEISDYIAPKLGWDRGAFGKSVKQVFMDTFDVSWDFIEEWKVKEEIPPGFDMAMRPALQFIGDGFRNIQAEIWLDLLFRKAKNPIVISDVRYINELKKTVDVGGITVVVYRPGFLNDDPNGSEAQIREVVEWFIETGLEGDVIKQLMQRPSKLSCCPDIPEACMNVDLFLINDGTLGDLYSKCDEWIFPLVEERYGSVK
jgi:hypothetical protein